ncbi:MAG TPA: aminoglycoside phosphotransferase family protein [Verrucomicrobia bacterium]|nr:aminoglycoside phosphotransferase family protein [Verrucomicrobiota bacterium]HOP97581.1 aminoglycoside phosphotransferase family protein [Verrucomicrobiota bacterium]HPU57049.1 aminoglycoside phosphotransferase family protein [Verrucomicrobiota bacterium]
MNNEGGGIATIARQFAIDGEFRSAAPRGSGHINDTWLVTFAQSATEKRYILQRINRSVFKDPAAVMENIRRVTSHLREKLAGHPDRERRVLTLVPTRDGGWWHAAPDGSCWRAYVFIEGASARDLPESPEQVFEAAKAFGQFQARLADLPLPRLHDTIPDFHNTPKRLAALKEAVRLDPLNRAAGAAREIRFVLARENMVGLLVGAGLPERVTHNDTKFNNVLLDDVTGEGLCVLDLETVMPGLALYDFGDLVRSAATVAPEDSRDLSNVRLDMPRFEAAARGYLAAAGSFLTREERRWLAFSGKLIALELGVRFLTDYLSGDAYFKVHREGQNLDRCRVQFRLVESMEQQEEAMHRCVERVG